MAILILLVSVLFSLGWHSALPNRPVLALLGSCLTATASLALIAASHTTPTDIAIIAFVALVVSSIVRFVLKRSRGGPK
jgi:hypothetical protein